MKKNTYDEENSSNSESNKKLDGHSFENPIPNLEMLRKSIDILDNKVEVQQVSMDNLSNKIRSVQSDLYDINQIRNQSEQKALSTQSKFNNDMQLFGNKIKKRVSELEEMVNSQNEYIKMLDAKVSSIEKNMLHIIGYITSQQTQEKREKQGGSITTIQHQDLLQTFKELSNTTDSLANEIIPKSNDLIERYKINASLISIFFNDLEYNDWIDVVFNTGNPDENLMKFSKQTNKIDNFRKYYDDVNLFKTDLNNVKPNAKLYLPEIGSPFNKDYENLVYGKCDEKKMISILVFPGYMRGDKIDEKAKVYTDI